VLAAAKNKTDGLSRWAMALEERRGYWKAVVAIAAKNARMAWAMLVSGWPTHVDHRAPIGVAGQPAGDQRCGSSCPISLAR